MTNKYSHKIFVPYRVCPIGAHIDHQLGITSGFAINKGIDMRYNVTLDGTFEIITDSFTNKANFNLDSIPSISGEWYDYLIGTIKVLKENYNIHNGIKAHIKKTLPIGGLASSSAVVLCYLLALTQANDIYLENSDLINLVVKVENKYLNTKVGILDPSSEVYAKKDNLLSIDPLTKKYRLIKSSKDLNFEICLIYSGLTRSLPYTNYNIRVDECKVTAFLINSYLQNKPIEYEKAFLRNYSYDSFLQIKRHLPENFTKRTEHYFSELKRVKQALELYKQGDIENFGKIVSASGTSSIKNYETGSYQLEYLHNLVPNLNGVYGGRFCGAGFNGYYMALINPLHKEEIERKVEEKYLSLYPQVKNDFGIYFCNTSDGVKYLRKKF